MSIHEFFSGRVIAILGDSLELLANKEWKRKFDLILTDPPYNMSRDQVFHRPTAKSINYFFGEWDNKSNKQFFLFLNEFYSLAHDYALKNNGASLVFTSTTWISYLRQLEEATGFTHKGDIIWHKTNPVPQFRKRNYLSSHEMISWAVMNNDDFTFNFLTQKEMHNVVNGEDPFFLEGPIAMRQSKMEFTYDWRHPTQKPVWLLKKLLQRHSSKNHVILDPFAGSGSTAIAAYEHDPDLQVILVENDKTIYEHMIQRLKRYETEKI